MKYFLSILICLLSSNLGAQSNEEFICSTPTPPVQHVDINQTGGIYLPANGELRVLLVFVKFPDKNASHNRWPLGVAPTNMDNFIDPDLNTGTQLNYNLTYYFSEMSKTSPSSQGVCKIVGDAVYVEAPFPTTHYINGSDQRRDLAAKDILQIAVDPIVDFTLYDNWKRLNHYDHENNPDGTIDMIVMIYREQIWSGFDGEASIGGPTSGLQFDVEGGSKTIKTGFPGAFISQDGSGVTFN